MPLTWQIVAGDLDKDGKADLVWRNLETGDGRVADGWRGAETSWVWSMPGVPLTWQIVGVSDLDKDGKAGSGVAQPRDRGCGRVADGWRGVETAKSGLCWRAADVADPVGAYMPCVLPSDLWAPVPAPATWFLATGFPLACSPLPRTLVK